ncbi:MAG TPA: hypothetical protein PLY35_08280 [Thermotogota bacterium]|nr:hypothetical protein [Thermotogota bacterium]
MIKRSLLFIGPVNSRSGYGDHARDLLDSLIETDNFVIKVIPINWGMTPNTYNKYTHLLHNPNEPMMFDLSMQVTVPNEFRKITKFDIGVTAGIETNIAAFEWIEGLNRVDLIIVPSQHSADVFNKTVYINKESNENYKLNKPMEILFEGVKPHVKSAPCKSIIVNETLNSIPENYLFLFTGHWLQGEIGEDRKNVGLMIKLFLEAFANESNSERPALILKTGVNFSEVEIDKLKNRIESIKYNIKQHNSFIKDLPNVYILSADLTDDEMVDLYNHKKIKTMISFTKGEGFGRPLLEFSCVNKPIIASNWSGHLDFLNKNYSMLIDGELKNVDQSAVWKGVIIPESSWFNINQLVATNSLRAIVKSKVYNEFKNKALQLGAINRNKFSIENMKIQLLDLINKYVPQKKEIKLPKLNTIKIEEVK